MQDLKKKEGGGNGKAEELTDGTATKAGEHALPTMALDSMSYTHSVLSSCQAFDLVQGIFYATENALLVVLDSRTCV